MLDSSKPLLSLSVGEFIELAKQTLTLMLPAKEQNSIEDEHLNISQCAEFLGCSKVSIHNYKKLGMPFYRVGRKVLFKKSEILAFMCIGRCN